MLGFYTKYMNVKENSSLQGYWTSVKNINGITQFFTEMTVHGI